MGGREIKVVSFLGFLSFQSSVLISQLLETKQLSACDPVLPLAIVHDALSALPGLTSLEVPIFFQQGDGLLDLEEIAQNELLGQFLRFVRFHLAPQPPALRAHQSAVI